MTHNLSYLGLATMLVFSCGTKSQNKPVSDRRIIAAAHGKDLAPATHSLTKTLHAVLDTVNGHGVYCEDTMVYSMGFVRCLRRMNLPSLIRIEKDSIYGEGPRPIPIDPVLSDTCAYHFRSRTGDAELSVQRTSLTSIIARFRMNTADGTLITFEGPCDLDCGFILGAESEDGEAGAYFVDQYWSINEAFAFRIGLDGNRPTATVVMTHSDGDGRRSPHMYHIL